MSDKAEFRLSFVEKFGVSPHDLVKLLNEPVSNASLLDVRSVDFSALEDHVAALVALK